MPRGFAPRIKAAGIAAPRIRARKAPAVRAWTQAAAVARTKKIREAAAVFDGSAQPCAATVDSVLALHRQALESKPHRRRLDSREREEALALRMKTDASMSALSREAPAPVQNLSRVHSGIAQGMGWLKEGMSLQSRELLLSAASFPLGRALGLAAWSLNLAHHQATAGLMARAAKAFRRAGKQALESGVEIPESGKAALALAIQLADGLSKDPGSASMGFLRVTRECEIAIDSFMSADKAAKSITELWLRQSGNLPPAAVIGESAPPAGKRPEKGGLLNSLKDFKSPIAVLLSKISGLDTAIDEASFSPLTGAGRISGLRMSGSGMDIRAASVEFKVRKSSLLSPTVVIERLAIGGLTARILVPGPQAPAAGAAAFAPKKGVRIERLSLKNAVVELAFPKMKGEPAGLRLADSQWGPVEIFPDGTVSVGPSA
jgi:hypothetical protein